MPGPWDDYAATADVEQKQQPATGPWADFAEPSAPDLSQSTITGSYLGDIWRAFSGGYSEGYGNAPVGLSDSNVKWLQDLGVFRNEHSGGIQSVFQAFNEAVLYRGAQILDNQLRVPGALYRGAQAAGVEAGIPRDFVSLLEPFAGSLGLPGAEEAGVAMQAARSRVLGKLREARDLGVIGSPTPDTRTGTPAQAAALAVRAPEMPVEAANAAQRANGVTQNAGAATDKAGNIRLDLIDKPDAVLDVIRQAAEENGGPAAFAAARQGEIPLSQVGALSEATGVPIQDMTAGRLRGMGRLMRNDDEVRTAIQAMIQSAEDVSAKMKAAALTDTPDDLIALQEARMRHATIQEQVAGLTAEWGRTGNVFQEFRSQVKDANSLNGFLQSNKGETLDDLRNLARAGSALDPRTQLPGFLYDMRSPTAWDKFLFYWTNNLISGPVTHAKYIAANATSAAYESGIVAPIAGMVGAARRALGIGEMERAYTGEAAARLWGLIAGTPDALVAAYKAARTNLQTPLPGQAEKALNPIFQQRPNPIGGPPGTIIGLPQRGASAIHSFFNFLGYRAEIEAQAYRAASAEGLSPLTDDFWQRRQALVARPSDEAMASAIDNGAKLTFIKELGTTGKKFQAWLNAFPPAKLIVPFIQIPVNLMKAAAENTPFALLDPEVRAALSGKKGGAARDYATARIIAGGAIMGTVMNLALNDRLTGDGPQDPQERALWLLSHQPNSVRIGDHWTSYERFGYIGDLLGLAANLAEAYPHIEKGEYADAAAHLVFAAGRLIENEVGFQGLAELMQAMNDPQHYGARYAASSVATLLPFSSFQRQAASATDPDLREVKTFLDGVKYVVPSERQSLLPKRDWSGMPVQNPGYLSILRNRPIVDDPVAREMQALKITPTRPEDRINDVKLSPKLYDEYQSTAGVLTREMLGRIVNMPDWQSRPIFHRETAIKNTIEAARQTAAAAMQMHHPELIKQGIRQRVDYLTGKSSTLRPKTAPGVQ